MKRRFLLALLLTLIAVPAAHATSYITLPTDRELVDQSQVILIGSVEGSYVQVSDGSGFETVYEIRVRRSLKGGRVEDQLVRVVSPGGEKDGFGSYTPGSAHFSPGEKVLLFLSGSGETLSVTHMSLGAFRFGTARDGRRVLVRDLSEVHAFDEGIRRETLRSEDAFLQFIRDVVAKVPEVKENYSFVGEVSTQSTQTGLRPGVNSLSNPRRYTQMGGDTLGVRWLLSEAASGIAFHKQNTADLSGAGDGGVSVIQTALASWTNDAGSNVTLNYGGTTTQAPGATSGGNVDCNPFADCINVIQYNAAIGSAGLCSIVYALGDAGGGYRQLLDADVQISSSITNASAGLPSIMTHELGHAIGFRHSNAKPESPNDQVNSCGTTDATDDCVTTSNGAIMYWVVTGAGNGYTLQPWDTRAVGAVYPGSGAPPAPTNVVATATTSTNVQVTWSAASGATSYQIFRTPNNDRLTFSMIASGVVGTMYNDATATAGNSYLYKVRSFNGSASGDSNVDLATTVIFTNTLTPGVTTIKAIDFTELRTAADAVARLAGQALGGYTDPTLDSSVTVKAIHFTQIKSKINTALTTLGFPLISAADPVAAVTTITAAPLLEARSRVQ